MDVSGHEVTISSIHSTSPASNLPYHSHSLSECVQINIICKLMHRVSANMCQEKGTMCHTNTSLVRYGVREAIFMFFFTSVSNIHVIPLDHRWIDNDLSVIWLVVLSRRSWRLWSASISTGPTWQEAMPWLTRPGGVPRVTSDVSSWST